MTLIEIYATHINFLIVSVVAMFAYKSYLEASKQTTRGRLAFVLIFALILVSISTYFIAHGLVKYEKFDINIHYVPAAALTFILFMQISIIYNIYKKDRAIKLNSNI